MAIAIAMPTKNRRSLLNRRPTRPAAAAIPTLHLFAVTVRVKGG